MSRTVSPSAGRRYGLALVGRVWEVTRPSGNATRTRQTFPPPEPRKRDPRPGGATPSCRASRPTSRMRGGAPHHTSTLTAEGQACIFIAVDHCSRSAWVSMPPGGDLDTKRWNPSDKASASSSVATPVSSCSTTTAASS